MLAIAVQATDKVSDVIEQLRHFEGEMEGVSHVWLTDADGKLVSSVPLSRLLLSPHDADLASLATESVISCPVLAPQHEVAELFDKYNLLSLAVVDDAGVLKGVITADETDAGQLRPAERKELGRRTVGRFSHALTPSARLKP